MNAAHVHLVLNHVPLVGAIAGVLLLLAALARRSDELARAGLVAVVLSAAVVAPVYLSGTRAEDRVEGLPGVQEASIERHEEAAELSAVVLAAVGVQCLVGLVAVRRRPLPRRFVVSCIATAIVALGLMARAANFGGRIRHPEISGSAAAAPGER